ncbi:hypothetical protein LV457_02905 [Mycobacterium sp. MYCO198283]|uniref:hypothetical protein n=1 Tax=Mycobacterium sp. MYCO198283 TaxID=2883505 RepID=UPI001E36D11C|nr:hypothetical protein [Mycobacterium sp. MYCO198283]MCG5431239.1 hypothetical protein [Mycobacterium sp. MYCO198283]
MQTVKAKKALPGYTEGSVFQVDENSAAVLKERGDVEFVEDSALTAAGGAFNVNTSRNGAVTQLVEADPPPTAPAGVTRNSKHADLVEAAKAAKVTGDDGQPLDDAAVEALTKAELADKLGL